MKDPPAKLNGNLIHLYTVRRSGLITVVKDRLVKCKPKVVMLVVVVVDSFFSSVFSNHSLAFVCD